MEIAEIISILPRDDADEFQKILKGRTALNVHELVTQQEAPALTLAVHRFLQFPGDLTVEDAFARFKREAPNCIVTMYMYIVDDEGHLKGVIDMALAQNLR